MPMTFFWSRPIRRLYAQASIAICDAYAAEHDIFFIADKSKFLVVSAAKTSFNFLKIRATVFFVWVEALLKMFVVILS
jgi:hypothetical protein